MASPVIDPASLPVAPAQVGVDEADVVHRLVPMAADIERFGVAVCGYLAEYLSVVPDLGWSDVGRSRRCPHCDMPDAAPA